MFSKRFPKVLKLLFIIGLVVALLVAALRNPFSLISRLVILSSEYRQLLPYIVAQAKHETGNFTSRVFLTDNNFFGMKEAREGSGQYGSRGLRAPLSELDSKGNPTYYRHYPFRFVSVLDFLRYLRAVKFPASVTDSTGYVTELQKRGYFGFGSPIGPYLANVNRYLA